MERSQLRNGCAATRELLDRRRSREGARRILIGQRRRGVERDLFDIDGAMYLCWRFLGLEIKQASLDRFRYLCM